MNFVFVGERPSPRALSIGATWRNAKLSGATLRMALLAAGLDPAAQRYLNVFVCETGAVSRWSLHRLRLLRQQGFEVVALGGKVAAVLTSAGVPHRRMVHPAARGRIRKRERYCEHAAAVLVAGEGTHAD